MKLLREAILVIEHATDNPTWVWYTTAVLLAGIAGVLWFNQTPISAALLCGIGVVAFTAGLIEGEDRADHDIRASLATVDVDGEAETNLAAALCMDAARGALFNTKHGSDRLPLDPPCTYHRDMARRIMERLRG